MQIVLSTSPHVRHPFVLQREFTPDPSAMYTFAPVGLLSLCATLRNALPVDLVLFDLNQEIISGAIALDEHFYRNAAERICANNFDVLGFMTECDSYHHVLQIAEQVKQLRPECFLVFGGPHASAVARPTLERCPYIDAIGLGEGEYSFRDLIGTLSHGSSHCPPGVLRRDSQGSIVHGGPHELAKTLDELPIPAYDLYRGNPEEEIFIEVGRGCPFQCTFCSTAPFWERRHRVKSPERILSEVRLVQTLFQSRRVHFTHDLLTTDKQWVVRLCSTLIAAGAPVKWTCSARTDTVDRAMLEMMAAAGCDAIYFGIESGSQRVLREIHKDIPIEHSLNILRTCRDVGIKPNAGFIVGFPTESYDSLRDTFIAFERALELGSRPTHLFGFCPFAQSSLYGQLDELECHRHFLDIPITPEIDELNRERIASDPELFGSYFRPKAREFGTLLYGVDEFSCLVEAVLLPAIELARASGGMLNVYEKWNSWIEKKNVARGVSPNQRFYGSPIAFCEFVIEELRAIFPDSHYIVQLAQVIHTNLKVAREWSGAPPTTMATHRSINLPKLSNEVSLSDQLRLNAVLATMRLDYDLTTLLDEIPENAQEPKATPTYFMWHLTKDQDVQLSEVDPFLFSAAEQLKNGSQSVATLMVDWAQSSSQALDHDRLLRVLSEAKTLGIVDTV
jgi:pyruvate-formate lyase-activating enzyme